MRNLLYYIYLAVILTISIYGGLLFKKTGTPTRVIIILIISATLNEISTVVSTFYDINKNPVYHIYSVVELELTTIYFLYTIAIKRKTLIAILAGIMWSVMAIINCIYCYQPLTVFNSNYLLLETIVIIGMSLYALIHIFKDDSIVSVINYDMFFVWISFLVLWTGSFFFWAGLSLIYKSSYRNILASGQAILNIVTYIGVLYSILISTKQNKPGIIRCMK